MSDFKAKMHQNRFRLGSAPDPAGGDYSAPRPPSWNKGALLLLERETCRDRNRRKGGKCRGGEGKGGERRECRGLPCVSLNFP